MTLTRITYLILSIILPSVYLYFLTPFIGKEGFGNVGGFFMMIFLFVISIVIFEVIKFMFVVHSDNFVHPVLALMLPVTGLFSLFFKKIHYFDLGNFYLHKIDNDVYVFEQNLFYMINIFHVQYTDVTTLRSDIEMRLEERYKEKLKVKRENDEFKEWSGVIDKGIEREKSINEILDN